MLPFARNRAASTLHRDADGKSRRRGKGGRWAGIGTLPPAPKQPKWPPPRDSHGIAAFADVPLGEEFFLGQGKTLYVKTGVSKYAKAPFVPSSFEFKNDRPQTAVRYPRWPRSWAAMSTLHRDADGKSRRRGKGGRWAAGAKVSKVYKGQLDSIDREILADLKKPFGRRKLPPPGTSVVYDRHYNNLAALGLIEWRQVDIVGSSMVNDHYELSKRARVAKRSERKYRAGKKTKLVTSQNTKAAERAVRSAATAKFGRVSKDSFYEHGQWWVTISPTGDNITYSAVDTNRGIDFERIGGSGWAKSKRKK